MTMRIVFRGQWQADSEHETGLLTVGHSEGAAAVDHQLTDVAEPEVQVAVLEGVEEELRRAHAVILDDDVDAVGFIAETDQHDCGVRVPVDVGEPFVDDQVHDVVHGLLGGGRSAGD